MITVRLQPEESWAGCYIRVLDVNPIYETVCALGLPTKGIPRADKLEDKPWGLREFAVVDPDGNLLRIGEVRTGTSDTPFSAP